MAKNGQLGGHGLNPKNFVKFMIKIAISDQNNRRKIKKLRTTTLRFFYFKPGRILNINLLRKFVSPWTGKVVENAAFLTDEEKENILANNVLEFVGRNRADFET